MKPMLMRSFGFTCADQMCEGRIKGAAIVATDVDFKKFLRVVFMVLRNVKGKSCIFLQDHDRLFKHSFRMGEGSFLNAFICIKETM